MRRLVQGITAVALLGAVPAQAAQDPASYKLKAKATFTGLIYDSMSFGSNFGTEDSLDGLPALFTFIYYQHAQAYASGTDGATFVSKYFENYNDPKVKQPLKTYVTINGVTKQVTNNYFGFGKQNGQAKYDADGNIYYQDGINFGGFDAEYTQAKVNVHSSVTNIFNQVNMNEYVNFDLDPETFGEGYFQFSDGFTNGTMGKVAITNFTVSAVPEPATWAMMILGFGVIGTALRRRSRLYNLGFNSQ